MKKLLLLAMVLGLLVSGCAHGITSYYPKCENNCAEITVLRKSAFTGGGVNYGVSLDGFPIAYLHINDFIIFQVPAGVHSLGLLYASTPINNVTITFDEGKKYYFLIRASVFSANYPVSIQRVEKDVITELMKDPEYKMLDMNLKLGPRKKGN